MCVSEFYPDGFLEETLKTMSTLFPEEEPRQQRRKRRVCAKNDADLEAQDFIYLDLREYQFWGERPRTLQIANNEARPRSLKQRYFDTRDKERWTTFWIAVAAFVLALLFRLISSITGIMQVYIAFKAS
jgi:hypothetical protein